MSLPSVPAGTNPYTVYLAALQDTLYQSPPASFRARIIILCTVCAYGVLISLAYWISLSHQYRSLNATEDVETFGGRIRPKWWIARRVDGYITLNNHIMVSAGGAVACACMLVYAYTNYLVLAEHRMMGSVNTWRSFMWISVTLEGYIVTCTSLQTYVVVARKSQRMNTGGRFNLIPSPRVFNAAFFALTISVTGAMVGSDIAFAVSWTTAWRAITKLRERLITYEATWQGGFDVSALLDLQSLYANVEEQVHLNTPYQHAVIISLIACAILIALLNVGSVSMLVLLRRQIKSSVARRSHIIALQPETPAPLTFNKRDLPLATPDPLDASPNAQIIFHPSTPSSPQKHDLRPSHSNDEAEHHRFARLSLPHLPRLGMGSRKSSEATLASNGSAGWGAWKEKWSPGNMKARLAPSSPALPIDLGGRDTLLDLKRAERDLLVCVSLVVTMGLMFGLENVWNLVYVLPNDVSWPAVEFSYFFCPWAFAIIYSTGCTVLVISSLIATRRHHRRERAMSLTSGRPLPFGAVGVGGGGLGRGAVGLDTFLGGGPAAQAVGMGIEFGEQSALGGDMVELDMGALESTSAEGAVLAVDGKPRRPAVVVRFPSTEREQGEKWDGGV